jgi:hypothetical protein
VETRPSLAAETACPRAVVVVAVVVVVVVVVVAAAAAAIDVGLFRP